MTMAIARSAASVGTLAAALALGFQTGRGAAAAAVAAVVGTARTSAARDGRRVLSERLLKARAAGMVAVPSRVAGMDPGMDLGMDLGMGADRVVRMAARRTRLGPGHFAGPIGVQGVGRAADVARVAGRVAAPAGTDSLAHRF